MGIDANAITDPSAQQLPDWHAQCFPLDVSERLFDTRERSQADGPQWPETEPAHLLDDMFDAVRVLADDEAAEIIDSTRDGLGLPLQCRFTPAVQAVLVRQHLDEDPVAMDGVDDECFDGGDFHLEAGFPGRDIPLGPVDPFGLASIYAKFSLHRHVRLD